MSVQPRPSDNVTEDFLVLGLPVVEFAFETSPGIYGAYFGLGIPESVEFRNELQFAQLRNAQSGASKLVRELVRQFDSTLAVTTFRHSGANMQLMFASSILTDVGASDIVVAAEIIRLQADHLTYLNLDKQLVQESPTVTAAEAEIAAEAVGTGQGTPFGETLGDFALDFKPLVIGDVTSYLENGVERVSDIIAGGTPATGEIGIIEGATATSGQIKYFTGEGPPLGHTIVVTYQPDHGPLVLNTDFMVDYNEGRLRIVGPFGGATDPYRVTQPFTIGYTYSQLQSQEIAPFTQFVFAGKTRVRQLTDVGENLIWTIPKTQVRLTPDAFTFNRDDLTVTGLAIQLLEDTDAPSAPYGTMGIYQEGTF